MDKGNRLSRLKGIIRRMRSVLIAFSSGTDSTFLLKVAADTLGGNVLAVTDCSGIHPSAHAKEAKVLASKFGVRHICLGAALKGAGRLKYNPKDRCYLCKKKLFSQFLDLAKKQGIDYVLDASNTDDLEEYRPGRRALKELKVRSPLQEAGFTKLQIRNLSRKMGLSTWDKPSSPCLLTRFEHGEEVTAQKLRAADKAEQFLMRRGFKVVRVRSRLGFARVEVERSKVALLLKQSAVIGSALKRMGFRGAEFDLCGYRSSSTVKRRPWKKKN